jgi:hypothetical protein
VKTDERLLLTRNVFNSSGTPELLSLVSSDPNGRWLAALTRAGDGWKLFLFSRNRVEDGNYLVTVVLRGSNGREMQKSAAATFAVGTGSMEKTEATSRSGAPARAPAPHCRQCAPSAPARSMISQSATSKSRRRRQ